MLKDKLVEIISDLNEGSSNPEYLRGQLELAANLLGHDDNAEGLYEELNALVGTRSGAIESLHNLPSIGTQVVLIREDLLLKEQYGAHVGAKGTVVGHSEFTGNDHGVLVHWGSGRPVSCGFEELAMAS